MFLSVFDLFKIGIGPSSSHTMGPMTAAARFLSEIRDGDWPRPSGVQVDRVAATLHGSLAYTGIGHGSDFGAFDRLGASGCLCGTLFVATEESDAHPRYKERLITASADDTVVTLSRATGLPEFNRDSDSVQERQ